jgi:broad specificity phosphatase PhoE
MAGELQPAGGPSYADWRDGIAQAMALARGSAGDVLVVSSGGTISTAIGHVLGVAPPVTIELNMQMRNSAVSQVLASPRGYSLVSYNHLPHLDAPERAAWVTYT